MQYFPQGDQRGRGLAAADVGLRAAAEGDRQALAADRRNGSR
jgi:hypothetical protein